MPEGETLSSCAINCALYAVDLEIWQGTLAAVYLIGRHAALQTNDAARSSDMRRRSRAWPVSAVVYSVPRDPDAIAYGVKPALEAKLARKPERSGRMRSAG